VWRGWYGAGKAYNDYGLGFYCTQNIELAKVFGSTCPLRTVYFLTFLGIISNIIL